MCRVLYGRMCTEEVKTSAALSYLIMVKQGWKVFGKLCGRYVHIPLPQAMLYGDKLVKDQTLRFGVMVTRHARGFVIDSWTRISVDLVRIRNHKSRDCASEHSRALITTISR